jgi:hypothetical protein
MCSGSIFPKLKVNHPSNLPVIKHNHHHATPVAPTRNWWEAMALAPDTYEYCLVVDVKWIPDSLARETVSNAVGEATRY